MHTDHLARHMRKHEEYAKAGSLYGSVASIVSSTTSLNEKYEFESELSSVSGTPVYKPPSTDKEGWYWVLRENGIRENNLWAG